jgi:hypothetical protein
MHKSIERAWSIILWFKEFPGTKMAKFKGNVIDTVKVILLKEVKL